MWGDHLKRELMPKVMMVVVRVHGKKWSSYLRIYRLSASVCTTISLVSPLSQGMNCPCFLLWPASVLISWNPFPLTSRTLLLHLFSFFSPFFFFNVLDHFCLHPNASPILKAEKPSLNPTSQAASPFLCSSSCSVPQESFLCSPSLSFSLILILLWTHWN